MTKVKVKPIKNYSDYSISSDGTVYSHKRGQDTVLVGSMWMGYRKVTLNNKSGPRSVAVHRLVAENFLDKPRGLNVVNHIDGNKSNNDLSNLEWTNHKGNSKHYGEKLAPVYKAKRDQEKQDSIKSKMVVLDFAFETFKDNPESFAKVYAALR